MLTRTSETGLRALIYLGLYSNGRPVPPRRVAESLGESPSYMSKIAGHLARADIIRTYRGVTGGMALTRPPEEISLLSVIEACQGIILADYCQDFPDDLKTCAFHQAMKELHESIVRVLKKWTLADLLKKPCPCDSLPEKPDCKLGFQGVVGANPHPGRNGSGYGEVDGTVSTESGCA